MMYQSQQMEEQAVLQVAAEMCAAARTAPKAKGIDKICTMVLTGEEKDQLAKKMEEIGKAADAKLTMAQVVLYQLGA